MVIYAEGIGWYVLILDCLYYNILAWSQRKWHHQTTHWLPPYIPMNKVLGILYLFFTIWLGDALLRLNIILFN